MASKRKLRQKARQITEIEYAPQRQQLQGEIQGVRRDTNQQVGSLQSMEHALQQSLGRASHLMRNSGLTGRDRRMALQELAARGVDVTAGTQLAISQAHKQAQTTIGDLRADIQGLQINQSQDTRAEFKDLMEKRRENMEELGLSPTQRRSEAESKQNAQIIAGRLYRAASESETGAPEDDQMWDAFTEAVAKGKGVGSQQHAVNAVTQLRRYLDWLKSEAQTRVPVKQGVERNLGLFG